MAAPSKGFDTRRHFSPTTLYFKGRTDAAGKLELQFEHKLLYLNRHYEVALNKLTLFNSDVFNVLENTQSLTYTKFGDSSGTRTALPNSRVVHSTDLVNVLNNAQSDLHFNPDTLDILSVKLAQGKLTLSRGIACALRILDPVNNLIPHSVKAFNGSKFAVSYDSAKQEVTVDGSSSKAGDKFYMFYKADFYVYNLVSTQSSQAVYVYSDLVEDEFISDQLQPVLAIVPLQEKEGKTVFQANNKQWKRIKHQSTFYSTQLSLADSTGRAYANVFAIVELDFRKRIVF